jgi:hypothetical protein
MLLRPFLILMLLLAGEMAGANSTRYKTAFISNNQQYTLRLDQQEWEVVDRSGVRQYAFPDAGFTSMTMLISNDGQQVVIVDDLMSARNTGSVLFFYDRGKEIKAFQRLELIGSDCFLVRNGDHFNWCLPDFQLLDQGSRFTLATLDFYELEFDLQGKLLNKKRPEGYDEHTFILFGEVVQTKKNTWSMNILKYIAGPEVPDHTIQFRSKWYHNQPSRAVMVRNGIDVTPKRFRSPALNFNRCLIRENGR